MNPDLMEGAAEGAVGTEVPEFNTVLIRPFFPGLFRAAHNPNNLQLHLGKVQAKRKRGTQKRQGMIAIEAKRMNHIESVVNPSPAVPTPSPATGRSRR